MISNQLKGVSAPRKLQENARTAAHELICRFAKFVQRFLAGMRDRRVEAVLEICHAFADTRAQWRIRKSGDVFAPSQILSHSGLQVALCESHISLFQTGFDRIVGNCATADPHVL